MGVSINMMDNRGVYIFEKSFDKVAPTKCTGAAQGHGKNGHQTHGFRNRK